MVKRTINIILFTTLISVFSAFGQETTTLGTDDGANSIVWEAVEGAGSYRIEIRRNGAVFIDTETSELQLNLGLSPGEYEYRIGVVDPFGKKGATTGWIELTVKRARTPYFRVTEPIIAWENTENQFLSLEIINIDGRLAFRLTNGETTVELAETITGSESFLEVDITGMSPGTWDLVATAPSGLSFAHPGALIIRPTRPPEITDTDVIEIFAEGLVPVKISGESFDEDMTVNFKGADGSLQVEAIEVEDGSTAIVYLNMQGAAPGSYDLILANPAGGESVRENAISVEAPIDNLKPKVQPRFEIQIGWAPMSNIPKDGETWVFGLATFETALTFHSGWTKPFVNGLGVETRALFGATNYVLADGSWGFDYIVKADLSGYWRPPVRGKAAPVFILGFGNMWSGLAASNGIENMLFVRFGLGVDFANFSRFTRLGLNFEVGFTDDNPVPMVSLMFRRGFRF